MPENYPSPAYRAFKRLLARYPNKEDQDRITQAMAILGITPDDKVWLAVTIGLDLIDSLARNASDLESKIGAAVDKRIERIGSIADDVIRDASKATSDANRAVSEAHSVASAINEASARLATEMPKAGVEVARSVGREIVAAYSIQLKSMASERGVLSRKVLIAVVLGAAVLGLVFGWVLHGDDIQHIVAACKVIGRGK